jgi:excisionase family DNA binding protein
MLQEDYPLLLSIQQAAKKIGKSEKTIRRWIHDGKLQAENRGGGYLIKREDLTALTRHVTKEWQEQSDLSHIKLQQAILEGQVEQLKMIVDAQQYEIEELQRQVKKLAPAKKPAPKKKTTSSRTTRHKRDDNFW